MGRKPAENPNLRHTFSIRLTTEQYAVLRAHAFLRNVNMSRVASDMLGGMLCAITDFDAPGFAPEVLGCSSLPLPEEKYPGYLASIGLEILAPGAEPEGHVPPSPERRADHLSDVPERPADLEFTRL